MCENTGLHRNRLNGCFPSPKARDPYIAVPDRFAETAANG
jgi:hypothetical protein